MQSPSKNQTQRIIGGVFGLPEPETSARDNRGLLFLKPGVLHLASARGAFSLLVRALCPHRVWLPSYLCSSIVESFQAAGAIVEFFPLNEDLHCESATWLQRVAPGDLVLRIHYFGFPNADPVFQEASARGACLVDDAAQALLSDGVGVGADFIVFSPRKFVGVPDGGCLVTQRALPHLPSLQQPTTTAWWLDSLAAVTLRRDFDNGSENRDWFTKFQSAEKDVPTEPFAMSELTQKLLESDIDFDSISQARRSNYQILLQHLDEVAMFPVLPDGVVPLGFPIRVRKRDAVRSELFREQIFPPIHWRIDGCVPACFGASHRLADETMTIPCDQRYGSEDMKRVAEVWQKATANVSS